MQYFDVGFAMQICMGSVHSKTTTNNFWWYLHFFYSFGRAGLLYLYICTGTIIWDI